MEVSGLLILLMAGLLVFVIGLLAGYLATKTWFRKRLPKAGERGAGARPPRPVTVRKEEES